MGTFGVEILIFCAFSATWVAPAVAAEDPPRTQKRDTPAPARSNRDTITQVNAPAISVLILTKNEQRDLPGALASVAWSNDILVFDSLSTDQTQEIARAAGRVPDVRATRCDLDDCDAHAAASP